TAVTFTADGKLVISAGADSTVRVWEASSGKELHQLGGMALIVQLAVAVDGQNVILTDNGGGITAWHPESGKHVQVWTPIGTLAALSRDGRQLAFAADVGTARVLDPSSGREVFALRKHAGPITGIAFSPDGARIATASKDRTVKVW